MPFQREKITGVWVPACAGMTGKKKTRGQAVHGDEGKWTGMRKEIKGNPAETIS